MPTPPDLLQQNRATNIRFLYNLMLETSACAPDSAAVIDNALRRDSGEAERADMENLWYTALRSGSADYSVYDSDLYLIEAWACWWTYSRRYLREIQKPQSLPPLGVMNQLRSCQTVVDLGNGLGLTTAALKTLFPAATVYGTNVPGSTQYRIASHLAERYGFHMVADPANIGSPTDLVFASEYFEHFGQPLDHLQEVVSALRPTRLLIANTFGGDAIGHFDEYRIGTKTVPGSVTGRLFNKHLRALGYRKVATGMWNNRPAYWIKEST